MTSLKKLSALILLLSGACITFAADLPAGDYFILVPAANVTQANNAAAQVDTNGGGGTTFSVALGPTSNAVPTWYACQWRLFGNYLNLYNTKVQNTALTNTIKVFSATTNTFTQVCQSLGLVRIQSP